MMIDPRSKEFRQAVDKFRSTGERVILRGRRAGPIDVRDPAKWRWYAVTVQAGSELALGEGLRRQGFPVWTPCKQVKAKKTRRHRSQSIFDVPVFRGFVMIGESPRIKPDWRRLFRNRRVWSIVGIAGQPAPIRYELIDDVVRAECGAVATGVTVAPVGGLKSIRLGDQVEVCGTALDQQRGIVSFIGHEPGDEGPAFAKIRQLFFGAERELKISVDNLRPVCV